MEPISQADASHHARSCVGGRGRMRVVRGIPKNHHVADMKKRNKGHLKCVDNEIEIVQEVRMDESHEIRKGLVRMRVSMEEFAKHLGISLEVLRESLRGGDPGEGVLSGYACLEVLKGGELVESEVVLEKGEDVSCVFGRPVRNVRLQVVKFSDGTEGRLRKKASFRPRHGLPCEVELSEEEGFFRLVGRYRDNGLRLS